MASSSRDNFRVRSNFSVMGTQIPEHLRHVRPPPYADNPLVIPPGDLNNPFGDPPRMHDVDPPKLNPYNDPDYFNRLVTENLSQHTGEEPKNWLLTYYERNRGDRPGGKLPDSASAQDRAVPFPDRPVISSVGQDPQLLDGVIELASPVLSRTVSSALGEINPLNSRQAAPPQQNGRPLGIVSGKPMPQWPFPPPIWGPHQ